VSDLESILCRAPLGRLLQLAYVVLDLESAAHRYARAFGLGPWSVYTLQPPALRDRMYRGAAGTFSMRIALADDETGLSHELISPLAGPSIYSEFLDRQGRGLHHAAFQIGTSLDEATEALSRLGAGVAMSGRWNEIRFAYLDGGPLEGFVEIWEMPAGHQLPRPDRQIFGAPSVGVSSVRPE